MTVRFVVLSSLLLSALALAVSVPAKAAVGGTAVCPSPQLTGEQLRVQRDSGSGTKQPLGEQVAINERLLIAEDCFGTRATFLCDGYQLIGTMY
jgi:hypothetical protein